MRILALAFLALIPAACGEVDSTENQAVSAGPAAPSYGDRVASLSDGQRRALFLRAIRDAALDCQEVTGASEAGRYRGLPVWRATCRGGGNWTIVINEQGWAQILNANEARLVTDAPGNEM